MLHIRYWKRISVVICFAIAISFGSCTHFPKDPNNTLQRVSHGILTVGVAPDGELAMIKNDSAYGREAELARAYAQSIDADIRWVQGSQIHLIKLLEEGAIDLAIGGFVKGSPLKKAAGWTRPYHTEKIKVAAPPGMEVPEEISGKQVLVKKGSSALVAVKKKNGQPIVYDSSTQRKFLLAAPEEELIHKGWKVSEYNLHTIEYVFAIQKGENAFLESLEKFIVRYVEKK